MALSSNNNIYKKQTQDNGFLKLSQRNKENISSNNIWGGNKTNGTKDAQAVNPFDKNAVADMKADKPFGQPEEKDCNEYFAEDEQGNATFDQNAFYDDALGLNFGNSKASNPMKAGSAKDNVNVNDLLNQYKELGTKDAQGNKYKMRDLQTQIKDLGGNTDNIDYDIKKASTTNSGLVSAKETANTDKPTQADSNDKSNDNVQTASTDTTTQPTVSTENTATDVKASITENPSNLIAYGKENLGEVKINDCRGQKDAQSSSGGGSCGGGSGSSGSTGSADKSTFESKLRDSMVNGATSTLTNSAMNATGIPQVTSKIGGAVADGICGAIGLGDKNTDGANGAGKTNGANHTTGKQEAKVENGYENDAGVQQAKAEYDTASGEHETASANAKSKDGEISAAETELKEAEAQEAEEYKKHMAEADKYTAQAQEQTSIANEQNQIKTEQEAKAKEEDAKAQEQDGIATKCGQQLGQLKTRLGQEKAELATAKTELQTANAMPDQVPDGTDGNGNPKFKKNPEKQPAIDKANEHIKQCEEKIKKTEEEIKQKENEKAQAERSRDEFKEMATKSREAAQEAGTKASEASQKATELQGQADKEKTLAGQPKNEAKINAARTKLQGLQSEKAALEAKVTAAQSKMEIAQSKIDAAVAKAKSYKPGEKK